MPVRITGNSERCIASCKLCQCSVPVSSCSSLCPGLCCLRKYPVKKQGGQEEVGGGGEG